MKLLPLFALVLAACGPSVTGNPADAKPGDVDARIDAFSVDANTTDAPLVEESKVYAHSGKQLYRIDTTTASPTPILIGAFTDAGGHLGTQGILDIAVDKNGNMMACTRDKIFTVDPANANLTWVADVTNAMMITSLSYVPVDLTDPTKGEILVAADGDGNVLQISANGSTTVLGSYGMSGADVIRSSGDIVAVYGEGIFATVNVGNDVAANDYLAKIDPVTWNATIVGTQFSVDKVFGLAYWRTKLYGFVDIPAGTSTPAAGKIIEIDPKTGTVAPTVTEGTVEWYGAGVTTVAPIVVN